MDDKNKINPEKKLLFDTTIVKNKNLYYQYQSILNYKEDLDISELRKIIYQGICVPPQRRKIWRYLIGDKISIKDVNYQQLLNNDQYDEITVSNIKQDVDRTFPQWNFFKKENGKGQKELFKILKAFSMFDPDIGYCQGMAYLCGLLLCHFSEEESFYLFINLMHHPKYDCRSLFVKNLIKLKSMLKVIEKLIEIEIPEIHEFFSKLEMGPELYATGFVATLCTLFFKFETIVRIWDIFLVEGWPFLISLIVGMVKKKKKDILNAGFTEIQSVITNFAKKIDPDKIEEISKSIKFKSTTLQKWESNITNEILQEVINQKLKKNKIKKTENKKDMIFEEKITYEIKSDISTIIKKIDEQEEDDDDDENEEEDEEVKNLLKLDIDFADVDEEKIIEKKTQKKILFMKEIESNNEDKNLNDLSNICNYLDNIKVDDDEEINFFE